MSERVTLLGRSPCPTCGAPMTPGTTEDVSPCAFCGSRAHVVRRLRTIEPLAVGGFEPGLVVGRADGPPAPTDGGPAACPGCGGPLETDRRQDLVRCPHCDACAKVERRLEPGAVGEGVEYPTPGPARGLRAWGRRRRDRRRDAAYRQVLDEADAASRVTGVLALEPWESLTPEREEVFVKLLGAAAAGTLFDDAVCHLVHRFLQLGPKDAEDFTVHPWRYFVLRAVTRVAFREEASGRLVQELRYVRGGGAALKLLLDIADYALRGDHLDYAVDALEAVAHTVADNLNWDRRHNMYDLLAYRLPYADERLAAWLLHELSVEWVGFLQPRALARLVDDCVLECPPLAPVIANQASYVPCGALEEYLDHLAFLQTLFTPLGRAVALECLIYVPSRGSGELDSRTLQFVVALLEALRETPESETAATRILRWWVDDLSSSSSDALRSIVSGLHERLPEDPPWPPSPRPAPEGIRLEKVARRLFDGVRQRSTGDRDGDRPEETDAWHRWREALDRLDEARRAQRTRAIEQQYPGSRLYWIIYYGITAVVDWVSDTIWRFRNPGGHG